MSGRGSQYKAHLHAVADGISGVLGISDNKLGYTVVEVMIFLAVSTGLFVMVVGTFSGRQAKAEFSTAAREMESRVQDIANDVSTGYYNNPGTFSCSVSLARIPQVTTGGNQQGTNRDCTFIGRVSQFAVTGATGRYNLFTVVGARLGTDGQDTDELGEANPRALTLPGLIEDNSLPVGLVNHSVWSVNNGVRTRISAIGFFTTFGIGPNGESSLSVNVVPLGDGNDNATDIANAIAAITSVSPVPNPNGGVLVCMNGNAINRHAVLRIGSSRGRLTTDVDIEERSCTDAGF